MFVFSFDEYSARQDSIDRGICLKNDGGWFDSLCIYVICDVVVGLAKRSVRSIRKIEGDIQIVDDL